MIINRDLAGHMVRAGERAPRTTSYRTGVSVMVALGLLFLGLAV